MRSGQYKISGSGSKGTTGNDDSIVGHFRSSQMEMTHCDSSVPEFPHMNSLVVTMNKMSESRPLNKSCENLSGPKGAVTRVEQRVKSFLQRGESRLKQFETPVSPPTPQPQSTKDGWQYGHVVTLPRRPRLSLALSHSALNNLSTSDTASCLSASSGYSSSSSSSYGSFKSNTSSNCSTLPRKKTRRDGHTSPSSSRTCTLIDNPMYDITPGTYSHNNQGLIDSLKRCNSPSEIHDSVYDFTQTNDPLHFDCKSHRPRSASVPRHNSFFSPATETDVDLQHLKKQTKRRGSGSIREPLYAESADYDLNNGTSHRHPPHLGSDPIYDTIPGGDLDSPYSRSPTEGQRENLYEVTRSCLLTPDSGTHGGLDSLEESTLDSFDCSDNRTGSIYEINTGREDQIAKECREYFEKRLKNSETLKKRWSMCSSDSGADSGDSEMSPGCFTPSSDAHSTSLASACSNSSSASVVPTRITSSRACDAVGNFTSGLCSPTKLQENSSLKKTPLDRKMEYLRKEIASLMKQDNQLFKQLLTLHESISALKSNPPQPHRPPSPASLDSFTEEEEEEEEDGEEDEEEEEEEQQQQHRGDGGGLEGENHEGSNLHQLETKKKSSVENLSDVDEGLETDHSLNHSISPTSTLSSKSSRDSTLSSKSCRDSTLSSKSSRDSGCSKESRYSAVEHPRPDCTSFFLTDNNTITTNESISIAPNNNCCHTSDVMIGDTPDAAPSVSSFASKRITRRYSITTNNDFNVNITINSEDSYVCENTPLSNTASHLSKSSCYLSKSDNQEATNLHKNKILGGSLGSFSPSSGRRLVRTRVSIPPSARNRDRSARPESFRLSSDMASHTRVLLKARSFAGASLRESPTHKGGGVRHFARTSLREDQLSSHRNDKRVPADQARSKMELLSKKFVNTNTTKSAEDVYFDQSEDEVYYDALQDKYPTCSSKSFESTSVVIVNPTMDEEHPETSGKADYGRDSQLESLSVENYEENVLRIYGKAVPNDLEEDLDYHPFSDGIDSSATQDVMSSTNIFQKEKRPPLKHPVRQFSIMIPDAYLLDTDQAYPKSQKSRARSFTGMMTPRTLPAIPPQCFPPKEVLDTPIPARKSTSSLKATEGPEAERKFRLTTMTQRARVTRDGYTFRFSSDLGLNSSSKVTPRSKREVFV